MKIFISYSLPAQDRYLVSLLVSNLLKKKFSIFSKASVPINGHIDKTITACNLFVGIVTKGGTKSTHTLKEWKTATDYQIPNILLIEKGIRISAKPINGNVITFDRSNPKAAQDALNDYSAKVQGRLRKVSIKKVIDAQKQDESNGVAAGVAALSLAALVAILASSEK